MTRSALFACCLALAGPVSAHASGIPLPPEWQGVWVSVDSVYSCDGSLIKVSVLQDTLCAGEDVPHDPNVPSYIQLTECSGSAVATHIQEHCAQGGGLCGEACFITDTLDLDATRTGNSAFWSWLTQTVSSCHASICDFCMLTHRHATRVDPASFCPLPVSAKPLTWGGVKAFYR